MKTLTFFVDINYIFQGNMHSEYSIVPDKLVMYYVDELWISPINVIFAENVFLQRCYHVFL